MRLKVFLVSCTVGFPLLTAGSLHAWGEDAHRVIATEALGQLDAQALAAVTELLGETSAPVLSEACMWPDKVRRLPDWEWSAPLHYVNIPRTSDHYDRQRDCPEGLCVTEGVIRYANELNNPDLDRQRRWQAFAFVCHLTADLHQPLHAGFKDDRGGNLVEIRFRDETYNLHEFWDTIIVQDRLGPGDDWERPMETAGGRPAGSTWGLADVVAWTNESHALAEHYAYPPGRKLDTAFADQTWLIVRQQWQRAAARLAQILNATLGGGEVIID